TELGGNLLEDPEDRLVVVDVERLGEDRAVRVLRRDLAGQLVEPVGTPRGDRQVVAEVGELTCHLGTETRARAGDQNRALAHVIVLRWCVRPWPGVALRSRTGSCRRASGRTSW